MSLKMNHTMDNEKSDVRKKSVSRYDLQTYPIRVSEVYIPLEKALILLSSLTSRYKACFPYHSTFSSLEH